MPFKALSCIGLLTLIVTSCDGNVLDDAGSRGSSQDNGDGGSTHGSGGNAGHTGGSAGTAGVHRDGGLSSLDGGDGDSDGGGTPTVTCDSGTGCDNGGWRVVATGAIADALVWYAPSSVGEEMWVSGLDDEGDCGAAATLHFDGTSWSRLPDRSVRGNVVAAARGDLWVLWSGDVLCPAPAPGLWRSADGVTWSPVDLAAVTGTAVDTAEALLVRGPDDVSVIASSSDSGVRHLFHWNGNTWAERQEFPTLPADLIWAGSHVLAFISVDDIWLEAQPNSTEELPLLHWDGAVWTDDHAFQDLSQGLGVGADAQLNDICSPRSGELWLAASVSNGPQHAILFHRDAGGWTTVEPPAPAVFFGLSCNTAQLWVSTFGGPNERRLFDRTGNGWTELPSGQAYPGITPGNGWVLGYDSQIWRISADQPTLTLSGDNDYDITTLSTTAAGRTFAVGASPSDALTSVILEYVESSR